MRSLPPLSAVRVFEAAARHQSFTQAAAELGMTQAAVSYQIKLLEQRLGVPLFLRAKRRVQLTEAGRRAATLVSAGLDQIADAFSGLLADNEGVLTISTTQTFASEWLAPRLGAFQLDRPQLAVRLNSENNVVDFAQHEVDVAIRICRDPGMWPGLKSHFLFRVHGAALASPEFRDRHAITEPADLLRVPRITPDDYWWELWFQEVGLAAPEKSHGGIRLDAQSMEGNAAMAGAGVAILAPIFWRGALRSGAMVQLFPQLSVEPRSYWLVYPDYKRLQPKVVAFRDWLLAEIRQMAETEPAVIFEPPELDAA
ncbi:MAG: LysR substrate-binding domain-containing protein [Allosphingosinicella sp.]|uniref:LysR substrate-binding domain-containing protein n=1 Tax=Allosphingosinicella sp. TaxID=2823234 RepID=UPI0039409A1F